MMKKIFTGPVIFLLLVIGALCADAFFFAAPTKQALLGGDSTQGTLDQWKSDGTNITQRTASKPVKITGLATGVCLSLDGSNILTTIACGGIASGGAYPFTPATVSGIQVSATSTPINDTAGYFDNSWRMASSSVWVCAYHCQYSDMMTAVNDGYSDLWLKHEIYTWTTAAQALRIPRNSISIHGDGRGSQINYDAAVIPVAFTSNNNASTRSFVTLKDVFFNNTGVAGTGTCIDLTTFLYPRVDNVHCAGTNLGIIATTTNSFYGKISNTIMNVSGVGSIAYQYTNIANDNAFDNTRAITSTASIGYDFTGVHAIHCTLCNTETNALIGVRIGAGSADLELNLYQEGNQVNVDIANGAESINISGFIADADDPINGNIVDHGCLGCFINARVQYDAKNELLGNQFTIGTTTQNTSRLLTVQGTDSTFMIYQASSTASLTNSAPMFTSPTSSVSLFIGSGPTGKDSFATEAADVSSGDIRFNGAGVAWGDFGYYPNGTSIAATSYGTFRLSTAGTSIGTVPNAKLGVGSIYSGGTFGMATTAPFGRFAIQINNGSVPAGLNAFIIASSTQTATTTLFYIDNTGTSTTLGNASSTGLIVSNLGAANCDVKASANGYVYCGTDQTGSSGSAPEFTVTFNNTYSTTTLATTSSLWTQGVFFSSSTAAASQIPFASTTAITAVNASTTNLNVSGATVFAGIVAAANRFLFITPAGLLSTGALPITVANGGTNATALTGSMLLASNSTGGTVQATSTPTADHYLATSSIASIFPYASTTGITASYASTSLLFANGLNGCIAGQYLTWSAGSFGCATDQNTGGGGTFSFTPSTYANSFGTEQVNSTTTPLRIATTTQWGLIASSTLVDYASSTAITISGNSYLGTVSSGNWQGTTIGISKGGTNNTTFSTGGLIFYDGTSLTQSANLSPFFDQANSRLDIGGDTSPDYRFEISGTSGNGYFGISTSNTLNGNVLAVDSSGNFGISTTSPYSMLSVAGQVVAKNFVATSTTATSTFGGPVIIGSTDGAPSLGGYNHPYLRVGTTTCPYAPTFFNIIESCGAEDSTNGWQIAIANTSPGSKAFTGYSMGNDRADTNLTNFAGLYFNSSQYSDTTFGTGVNTKSQLLMQNTLGPLSLVNSTTSASMAYVNILLQGSNSNNEKYRFTPTGLGISTTTPIWPLNVFATNTPQIALSAGEGITQWAMRNAGGNFYLSTTTVSGTATSSPAALTITPGGTSLLVATTSNSAAVLATDGRVFMANLTTSGATQTGDVCINAANELINDSAVCIISSRRFKERIEPLDGGLKELMQLRPVSYFYKKEFNGNWAKDPNYSGEQVGLIAEEVQKIDPRLITLEKDGTPHSVRYENLTALIINAIKDLAAKVLGLDKRIAEQDAKIKSLEARLQKAGI